MDSSGEISLLCRLCLVKEQVNVPIFGENGDIRQIFLKISSCLPVKVSKEDPLPKNICEGCSDKLDSLYTFWNTSRDAEKTLLSWLQQAQVDNADEAVSAISKQISAQSELVKEETELTQDVSIKEDNDETGAPPAKRARRTAAVKAQISISQEESEEEDDVDEVEPLTKVEDESDMSDNDGTDDQPLSTFVDMPGTSVDEEQAGPSGVGKEAADAPHTCTVCLQNFTGKKQLERHLANVTPDISITKLPNASRVATCNLCNEQLTGTPAHSDHECFHMAEEGATETDICIFCSEEVPLRMLPRHENAHKEEEKRRARLEKAPLNPGASTVCATCGATLTCPKDLKRHMRTHRRLCVVICQICGFPAKNIYQHMLSHSEERRHACQECGLAFKHKKNLKAHQLVHEVEGKHKCATCQKAFKTPYNLRVHMRSHQDVKPFACQYCDKTFTTKQSRDNHLKGHIIHNC